MTSLKAPAFKPDIDLPLYRTPQVWRGDAMSQSDEWVYEFTAQDLAEIDESLRRFERGGLDIAAINPTTFPLPGLEARLRDFGREVLHGRGFVLLRGIPVEKYTVLQSAIAYLGLGSHLGEQVPQNGKGHVLGHVKSLGLDMNNPFVRGYQTTAALNYHVDYSDIVGLLCLKTAKSGGLSSIVSSASIWNELVTHWPHLAQVLSEPFYYTRYNEVPEGKKPWAVTRFFSHCEGKLIANYVRDSIRKAQRTYPEVPRLTPIQVEAMAKVDELASDPGRRLDMELRPGDIQLISNHFTLHARTDYEDWPEPERRRHLLRMWLACDDGPTLPDFYTSELQYATASGRPNGIVVPGVKRTLPLDAE